MAAGGDGVAGSDVWAADSHLLHRPNRRIRTPTEERTMPTSDEDWPNGTPCWVDVLVTDPAAAKTFYSSLFGWEFRMARRRQAATPCACSTVWPVAAISPKQEGNPFPNAPVHPFGFRRPRVYRSPLGQGGRKHLHDGSRWTSWPQGRLGVRDGSDRCALMAFWQAR